jgi:hypothetical protein
MEEKRIGRLAFLFNDMYYRYFPRPRGSRENRKLPIRPPLGITHDGLQSVCCRTLDYAMEEDAVDWGKQGPCVGYSKWPFKFCPFCGAKNMSYTGEAE